MRALGDVVRNFRASPWCNLHSPFQSSSCLCPASLPNARSCPSRPLFACPFNSSIDSSLFCCHRHHPHVFAVVLFRQYAIRYRFLCPAADTTVLHPPSRSSICRSFYIDLLAPISRNTNTRVQHALSRFFARQKYLDWLKSLVFTLEPSRSRLPESSFQESTRQSQPR